MLDGLLVKLNDFYAECSETKVETRKMTIIVRDEPSLMA